MHTRTLQAALIAGQLMMANVATQVGDDYFAEYQKNPQTGQQELVFTDFIDNGEGAANRLFIKDPDATKDTKYRYGYGGYYYEMEMIPTSFYDEEDFRSKGLSQSQYDKDRREWVFGSGADYSDKGRWKRFTQDLGDSDN